MPFHRDVIAGLCLLALVPAGIHAAVVQPVTLVSPIDGRPFTANMAQDSAADGSVLADMGSDDDGCRHSSGPCEYNDYVAVDPNSYFAALTIEWNPRTFAFRTTLSREFKEWVLRTFNGEMHYNYESCFKRYRDLAQITGQPLPDRATFQLQQSDIPVEMRYWLALECYRKRNAPAATVAKVALNGAWAIRVQLNMEVPKAPFLADGISEVNDLITRDIKDGESFDFRKWHDKFRTIFEDKRLSNEGYLVAGWTYFGYAVRDGDRAVCEDILNRMTERFKDEEKGQLSGLVRDRRRLFFDQVKNPNDKGMLAHRGATSYIAFMEAAASNFIAAIANEEFTRAQLPVNMLATAECLRRIGAKARAMDWYLALAELPETQPTIRQTLRAQGKFPGGNESLPVQLGWRADAAIKRMTDENLVHPGKPMGPDRDLINAILKDGLGTAAFVNPSWRPVTGQSMQELSWILNETVMAVADFAYRRNAWPRELGELWEHGFVRDRNRLNRFCCPVTGKPLLYQAPETPLDKTSKNYVLLATQEAVTTNQGPRYAAMLLGKSLIWSEQPIKPGTVWKGQ